MPSPYYLFVGAIVSFVAGSVLATAMRPSLRAGKDLRKEEVAVIALFAIGLILNFLGLIGLILDFLGLIGLAMT